MMDNQQRNYFGKVNFRGKDDIFGIKDEDRTRHMYVIGKTGMGKTAMLQNMAIQDVVNNAGMGIIDPHGDFADRILDFVPEHRINDVVYLNPADSDFPIGLNLLEDVGYDKRHLVASGLLGAFKKIWADVWSARMEYIISNTILALMEYPNATLLDINSMMTNKQFRAEVLEHVKDPIVREFWLVQFVSWGERLSGEATAAVENKVGQFTAAPLIRNIVGQQKSTIDIRKIMDEGKILIVNLSKGYIGEENSRLLGAMIITKLYLSAMSRVDIPEEQRRNFILYVDEFQNFASDAFEGILSEARKYGLSLVLAHQYIEQMDDVVRASVFGNVGSLVAFRIGATDAEHLEKEFTPSFLLEDIINLGKYEIVLRLMIDGVASTPFSATTLPPIQPTHGSYRPDIITSSRSQWSISREQIEGIIAERSKGIEVKVAGKSGGGGGDRPAPRGIKQDDGTMLYIAECEGCQKNTRTILDPESGKKIYCKKCRKQQQREREERQEKRDKERTERRPSTRKPRETRETRTRSVRAKDDRRGSKEFIKREEIKKEPAVERKEEKKEEKEKPVATKASVMGSKDVPKQYGLQDTTEIAGKGSRQGIEISLAMARKNYPPPKMERYYTTSAPPQFDPIEKKEIDKDSLRSVLQDALNDKD